MKYSVRMERVKPSAIRDVQKKIAQKPGVISFAAGLPDPDLFPLDDLKRTTMSLIEREGKSAFQYGLTRGYGPLIDHLVERMAQKEQIHTTADNVIITNGSQQGLAVAAMVMLDEGDVVVAENPSYLGGINACRPYGCTFAGVDTDDDGMVMDDLRRVLKENPRAKLIYVIPNFQNPTGKAWTLERRKEFMEIINEYDDIVVVEDNPYGEIRFKGEFIPTLKSMDTKNKIIYLGSFSKILCPGLRVAWVCADSGIIRQMEVLKEGLDLQCNQFAQMQVYEYMKNCDIEAHIDEIKAAYKERCEFMLDKMGKLFPAGVKYTKPDGGMFIWVELPNGLDASEVLNDAIDAGVAYIPGEFFYANDGAKNTMRLNYTTMSEEQIAKGIKILAEVFKRHIS